MFKTCDHNGKPAGHGKVQVNAKNVEPVMLPRGYQLAEECPNEPVAGYLKSFRSYKSK